MARGSFHQVGDGIWEHIEPVRFLGISLPHRMTVVRMSDGTLLLHSPTRCSEPTLEVLRGLGTVRHIVAPNAMHDLFLEDYARCFPEASIWIPPESRRYFPTLITAQALPTAPAATPWHQELGCVLVRGIPRLNECAFYHRSSRSLIVADLLFHIGADSQWLLRLAARLGGFYKKLGVPLDIRWFLVKNKEGMRQSVAKILAFPFENVVIGHGRNAIGTGRRDFEAALAWLR